MTSESECFPVKIVLAAINAKYIHSNLAVYSLKACGEQACDGEISIAEFTINNYIDDILPKLYKARPDILAFSCYIWNISMVEELAELIHKAAPWVQLWFGGPEVSFDPEDVLLRNPWVKLVMCGEGEETFSQLAAAAGRLAGQKCRKPESVRFDEERRDENCLDEERRDENCLDKERHDERLLDEALLGIAGLVFRNADGGIVHTGLRPAVAMDDIPFPYKDMAPFKNKIIYYESSRGCPFSCSYCLSSIDKHVRFRSLPLVKEELAFFLEHKVPQVKFVDRTFNCSHERTLELWRFIREHDNGITNFHFEITADLLNEEELQLLKTLRPGLVQLEIGVQSTNPQTIREIDRIMDFNHLSSIVRRIQEGHNVHQHLDLIAGLPYEDFDSFKQSFNDVYSLKPQQLQMGFLKVLKGSKMHRSCDTYDLVYRTKPVYEVISTRWLSFEELLVLKGVEAMVEIYYNSCQFRLSLDYLEHFFGTPFDLFFALARYYEARGLNEGKHSRLERYALLRRFAGDVLACEESFSLSVFEEILTYDIYLRENVKTRPDWACDEGAHKAAVSAFYSSPEMRQKYFKDANDKSYRQIRHQTHVELFSWNVPLCAATGQAIRAPRENTLSGVLFDYSHRDALTYEAKTTALEENF